MTNKIKFGVLKETKNPPDRRVAVTPRIAKKITKTFPNVDLFIQKSELRAIHFSSGTILTFDKKGNSVRTEQSMEIKQIETSNNSLNESEEKEENKRKPSKKEQEYFNRQSNVSLIFGFLSLIPVIGCVFSMIAIVSGNVLLNKTEHIANQDKTRKKARIGRGLGTMTIVLGTMIVLAMLIFLVLL